MLDKVHYLHVCIVTTASIALVIAASVVIRRIGLRLEKSQNALSTRERATVERASQLSVFDMFVFIACSGIIVAASKPLLDRIPKITLQFLVDAYWLPTTLAASVISLVVMLTVLSQRWWLARGGIVFAGAAWCALVVQQLLMFAGFPQRYLAPTALQTIVLASTSALICALSMRLRNYRVGRAMQENPDRNLT